MRAQCRDVLEEREESPGIIPPVATPPQPQAKERHAYRHKATDGFSDCRSTSERTKGVRKWEEGTFDLDERVVNVDAHDGGARREGRAWSLGALLKGRRGKKVDIRDGGGGGGGGPSVHLRWSWTAF